MSRRPEDTFAFRDVCARAGIEIRSDVEAGDHGWDWLGLTGTDWTDWAAVEIDATAPGP